MYPGPLERIGLVLAEDLAGDGSGVAFAECQELQQVDDRIAFGQAEVRVRRLSGFVANVEQERGDGVRDRGADRSQHAVAADLDALDVQMTAEF